MESSRVKRQVRPNMSRADFGYVERSRSALGKANKAALKSKGEEDQDGSIASIRSEKDSRGLVRIRSDVTMWLGGRLRSRPPAFADRRLHQAGHGHLEEIQTALPPEDEAGELLPAPAALFRRAADQFALPHSLLSPFHSRCCRM
jgi:hypothetical protein